MGECVSMKNEYRLIEHPGAHWILIAEDDSRLAGLLREYFVEHGFAVEIESRGAGPSNGSFRTAQHWLFWT